MTMLGNKCSITFSQRHPNGHLVEVYVDGVISFRIGLDDEEIYSMLFGIEQEAKASGKYRVHIFTEKEG